MPAEALESLLARRRLLLLLGGGALLAACGKSASSKPLAAASGGRSATTSTSPSTAASSTASAAAGPQTVHLGGAHVDDAITKPNVAYLASVADGAWRGAWRDSAGRSGTTEVAVSVSVRHRTATGTVTFSGDLLGSPVSEVTYVADLLSYMITASRYTVSTPQFGTVSIEPGGEGRMIGTAKNIADHPEIHEIRATGQRGRTTASCTYDITLKNGHVVKGAMAWSSKGRAAAPAL